MKALIATPKGTPGLPDEVADAIEAALVKRGHDVHRQYARGQLPGIGARALFDDDFQRLARADLLVADVSNEDAGVGWQVAWFLAKGRNAILTVRKDALAGASSWLAGNPNPWQQIVRYEDAGDLSRKLDALLA